MFQRARKQFVLLPRIVRFMYCKKDTVIFHASEQTFHDGDIVFNAIEIMFHAKHIYTVPCLRNSC
jgi:hypothetical protein